MTWIDWDGFSEGENLDIYPTFPDIESAIKHFAIDKEDKKEEEDLQSLALREFCRNETELLSSKTAVRIIKIAEIEKLSRDIQTLALDEPEKIATWPSLLSEALKIWKKPAKIDSYNRFINWEPISKRERDYLITLFKNPEIKTIILETLSKINILYWPENKEFIKRFLENEKWEYDISNPLRCVLHNLENCPFVVDFSFDEIIPWRIKVNYPVWWQYFIYKKWNKQGFVLKLDDKLYYLTTLFDKLNILSNWLVFWIVDLNKDGENKDEYKIWKFYQFNWIGFEEIYRKKWIKNIYEFSEWLICIKWDNEKYWMLRVNEIQKDIFGEVLSNKWDDNETEQVDNWIKEFKVDKVLDTSYDKLEVKNGLILAFNEDEDRGFWKLELFKNTQVNFTKTPFQIKDFTLKLREIDNVTFQSYFKQLDMQFYEDWKLLCVETLIWSNFYSFNEEKNELNPINWLQWIKIEQEYIESRLFSWLPVLIKDFNNNSSSVIHFNKETWNISELIKLENNTNFISNFYKKTWLLKIGQYNKSPKLVYLFDKNNWDLFIPKKWYRISGNFIKKRFFWKKIQITSFEDIKEFLERVVVLPIIIK